MKKIQPGFSDPKQYHDYIYRLEFTDSHKPLSLYIDKQRDFYYILVFRNHAIAESPQYGNVSFVLKGTTGWLSLFSKSRQELRKNSKNRVAWIRHTITWKKRLSKYLN